MARYGKSLSDAVDFYEIHLKTEASLREIKLEPFVRDFLNAKEEGKSGKKKEGFGIQAGDWDGLRG